MLETLHMWQSTRVEPALFEFIYREYFQVSIPCVKYKPIARKIDIKVLDGRKQRFKDQWPKLSAYWLTVAKERVSRFQSAATAPEVLSNSHFLCNHDKLFACRIDRAISFWILVCMHTTQVPIPSGRC